MGTMKKDFPEEMIHPIKALTDQNRRKILLFLLENEQISYSQLYSQIKKENKISKGTFNHHLQVLVGAALIRNFNINNPSSNHNSFYTISNFGRRFLEGLHQTLQPECEIAYLHEEDGANASAWTNISGATFTPYQKVRQKKAPVEVRRYRE
jgi:DNA-binding transcriptional ArsR family regulator